MDITSFSKQKVTDSLDEARQKYGTDEDIRLLFVPNRVTEENFEQVCDLYGRIDPNRIDTAIIIESYPEVLDKKLSMPSFDKFMTPFGEVPAHDTLRNEFCDEDDDFFIYDKAYNDQMSLFHHLMMLQAWNTTFSAVSIQLADNDPAIVKELGYVLEDVLAARKALLIFCCDLETQFRQEFENVRTLMKEKSNSPLMNFLNSGESHIKGTGTFIAGAVVAREWGLEVEFLNDGFSDNENISLIGGFGAMRRAPIQV